MLKIKFPRKIWASFILVATLLTLISKPALASTPTFTPEEIAYIENSGKLPIGTLETGVPFQFQNKKGETTGITIKILDEISNISGLEFDIIVFNSSEELFASNLELLFGFSPETTPENYLLTRPFLESESVLFYRKGLDPTDLKGKRLALLKGSNIPRDVEPNNVIYFSDREEALLGVEHNQADYGYANSYSITYYTMQHDFKNVITVPIDNAKRTYSFALINSSNPLLYTILNKSVKNIDQLRLQSIILSITADLVKDQPFTQFFRDNWQFVALISNIIILLLFIAAFYIYIINTKLQKEIKLAQKKEEEIRYLNYYDALTDLPNRRFYEESLIDLDIAKNLPFSVIVGDLNGLKISNDAFGHEEGDKLLVRTAVVLKKNCPLTGQVFRLSGDEYVMLLPKTDGQTASEIINKINHDSDQNKEGLVPIKISLGYATKTQETQSIIGVIKLAEDMMYKEKMRTSQNIKNGIIADLIELMFAKGIEKRENIERTQNLAIQLAFRLNLFTQDIEKLKMLVKIHDIGKIAVNEEILFKEGPLTLSEQAEMRKHIEVGYRIADASNIYSPVAKYILTIREHYDGGGYPLGLKGEEIPLISRIFQIVDSYVQMTDHRLYKDPLGVEQAKAELLSLSGKQFDPKLLAVFIEMLS